MPAFLLPVRLILVGVLLAITSTAVQADNWERFRGPNGDGIAKGQNVPIKFDLAKDVRWKVKIPGDGNGSPIIWGDRVFLQTSALDGTDRSLLCLDAKSGQEIWKRTIKGTKVKFRQDSSHASATPATDGESVFIPFWNGKDVIMIAYSFKGDKLWERNFGEFVSQHGAGASPIIYKDLVIFSIDKDAFRDTTKRTGPVANPSTLYALDKKTGKTVWEKPREANRACYSMPYVVHRPGAEPELIVTSTTAITSYEPLTGETNWYWNWKFTKDPLRTIAASVHTNGMLLACSGDGSGERLMVGVTLKGTGKVLQPEQAWTNGKFKEPPYVTNMLARGNHVYYVSDMGNAACIDPKTGNKAWFENLPDARFYSSPVMIDDCIYAASDSGDIYVIAADAREYRLLAKNALGERVRATPAVANGAIFIRAQFNLYCISSK